MKMKKKFAVTLLAAAAAASTAMVACDDKNGTEDDKLEKSIAGDYKGKLNFALNAPAPFPVDPNIPIPDSLRWNIKIHTTDTILVTTDSIPMIGMLSVKAYNKQERTDSTLYTIAPMIAGIAAIDSGKVCYRYATKTSAISAKGKAMSLLPFSITLTGTKE
ncbi:MAG: hypothetical protein LBG47_01510 [Prevotellaceae bacterium]|jgi:hypothetical protein|nr:hypothetical protein [Prevotellaceae bacterium]